MHATRRRSSVAHLSILVVLVTLLLAAVVPVAVGFVRSRGHEFITGQVPVQFYRQLEDRDLLDDYRGVFAIAHNSGGTLEATIEALAHSADVVEIDVISVGGTLHSSHRRPLPIISRYIFRGPTVAEIWEEASGAEVIKLDLKGSTPEFVRQVIRFLRAREPRETIVVSGSLEVLGEFEASVPDVVRILSIPDARALDVILADPQLVEAIDGVSVRASILTPARLNALQDRSMLIFAWTVNDLQRVNELVMGGVDAVTTDNLAIMELLGGPQRGEARLRDRLLRP